ncbi:hypothetical protein FC78_GL001399 [Companilactobacillus bobalius DSM 19674]|nr:hypothetical protein FC78_GL001399 [Companilactobacillus bobalius DSM 19674]
MSNGGVQEKFEQELKKVSENILDENTDAKKKRSVTITLTYLPNDNRDAISVYSEVKSKLVPQNGVSTTLLVGRNDDTGAIEANELKSGIKGQTYIDDNGDLRTDTGEKIENVENKDKQTKDLKESSEQAQVIDLQKQGKKA